MPKQTVTEEDMRETRAAVENALYALARFPRCVLSASLKASVARRMEDILREYRRSTPRARF